jgi:hypothetical protein
LERFLDWMSKKGRKYVTFQQAIDQAVATATAENVLLLKRAARRGKLKAAVTWLQSQAPTHFPPRAPVNIGTVNNNLLALIKETEARRGSYKIRGSPWTRPTPPSRLRCPRPRRT